jgi:RHS repeat-associated protein
MFRCDPTSSARFLFQGRDYLKEGGIYDYRNRFYHPGLGRFLQPDPIGFKGDAGNLYRYCGNDPVDRSDPMGLIGEDNQPKQSYTGQLSAAERFHLGELSFQGGMLGNNAAAALRQIEVAEKLDSAARALGARLVEVSRTNSDKSQRGTGWERGKTVGLVGGKVVEGDRTNVAYEGTRFIGPQKISWTDPPPGATKYVFVHAPTSTARDKEHNTMTTAADRLGANQTHSAIYTIAADPHGGYIAERYRPSAIKQERKQGINGVTELWSNSQWHPISN